MGNLNFDATNIAPSSAFDPLPPGWYGMRVVEAEMKDSPTAGEMLKLRFDIDENSHPDNAGRCVFTNLCINHPASPEARRIAQQSLSAICHAIGKVQIGDTTDLLGATLLVKLKVVPASTGKDGKNYDARNECTGFKGLGSSEAPKSAPAAAKAPASAPARPATPSWKK